MTVLALAAYLALLTRAFVILIHWRRETLRELDEMEARGRASEERIQNYLREIDGENVRNLDIAREARRRR